MDEVEIISLHKRRNKTDPKAATKTGAKKAAKTGTKTGAKAPRSGYHIFLREQLETMTGEDRKNYSSIVSRRWKEIKEDLARLFGYNNRARQMKDEAEKPTKLRNDPSVGSMVQHEETMTERSVV